MTTSKIDYHLTVQNFLKSVRKFLDGRMGCATTMWEYNAVAAAMAGIARMMINPGEYCGRDNMMTAFAPLAFVHNGTKTGAYVAFVAVMAAMRDMYAGDGTAGRKFLGAVKRWNYQMSKNSFKDLYYPFLSPMRFAVKRSVER